MSFKNKIKILATNYNFVSKLGKVVICVILQDMKYNGFSMHILYPLKIIMWTQIATLPSLDTKL